MNDLITLLEDLKEYMEPKVDVETEFRDIDTVTTGNKEMKFYGEIEDALKRLKSATNVEQQIQRQQKQLNYINHLSEIVGKWPGGENIEEILDTLKKAINPLLHAAKNILIEWDSRMPEGEKEELKTAFFGTHSYWSPSAMLVSSQYIAALRSEVEKLEKIKN